MNNLQIFNNPEFGEIRTIQKNGEPWFVGKDVATALGYEKPTDAVRKRVDEEDKGVSKMETPSGPQEMTVINESGLYCLIFSSKLEKAKSFKRWVTAEVLPSIRKTGSYAMNMYPPAVSPNGLSSGTSASTNKRKEKNNGNLFWYPSKSHKGNGVWPGRNWQNNICRPFSRAAVY